MGQRARAKATSTIVLIMGSHVRRESHGDQPTRPKIRHHAQMVTPASTITMMMKGTVSS